MICETCHGTGRAPVPASAAPRGGGPAESLPFNPCPDCDGCGIAHCCDGLTACNDQEERDGV